MAEQRFASLDGWRGISILLVLAAHLIPLGPKALNLNETAGPAGMALFFTLSGFLITNFLLNRESVVEFLIRRFFRIIPLAWLYIVITLSIAGSSFYSWCAHLLFYANWPPMHLIPGLTRHFWSLCVEVQFYVGIALLVSILSKRGLLLIPIMCIAFTVYRYLNGVPISGETFFRIDEILAGSIIALIWNNKLGSIVRTLCSQVNPYILLLMLFIASHPDSGLMSYFRPYFAAMLVGSTLFNDNSKLTRRLDNELLIYVATISYALYVIHPILLYSWLAEGETLVKYAKRPMLFVILFLLAHFSTFYYEKRWIKVGKILSDKYVSGAN